MIVNVGSEGNYKTIGEWWNNLEWVNYDVPSPRVCNQYSYEWMDLGNCLIDEKLHYVASNLKLEWAYKLINHNVDKVIQGFIDEFHRFEITLSVVSLS